MKSDRQTDNIPYRPLHESEDIMKAYEEVRRSTASKCGKTVCESNLDNEYYTARAELNYFKKAIENANKAKKFLVSVQDILNHITVTSKNETKLNAGLILDELNKEMNGLDNTINNLYAIARDTYNSIRNIENYMM